MLDAIPGMRDALATADATELAEIFDVTATYDKPNARLELATARRAVGEFVHSGGPLRRSW
jgi:hypothetical protein